MLEKKLLLNVHSFFTLAIKVLKNFPFFVVHNITDTWRSVKFLTVRKIHSVIFETQKLRQMLVIFYHTMLGIFSLFNLFVFSKLTFNIFSILVAILKIWETFCCCYTLFIPKLKMMLVFLHYIVHSLKTWIWVWVISPNFYPDFGLAWTRLYFGIDLTKNMDSWLHRK